MRGHEKRILVWKPCRRDCMVAGSAQAQVKVGNAMAVTGPIPDLVAPMVARPSIFAAKHINEQGGMYSADGQALEIVRADSACDPVRRRRRRHQADQRRPGRPALIGPVCSGATIAQAESVSVPAGVVTLSVSASSPAITTMEDRHGPRLPRGRVGRLSGRCARRPDAGQRHQGNRRFPTRTTTTTPRSPRSLSRRSYRGKGRQGRRHGSA